MPRIYHAFAMILLLTCLGCGKEDPYRTTKVSGTLTCQGQPVPGAYVLFRPEVKEGTSQDMPGKPAMGLTDKDGNFTLSTYGTNDGAMIGMHQVSASPDGDRDNIYRDQAKKLLQPCLGKFLQVEVKPGMGPVKLDF